MKKSIAVTTVLVLILSVVIGIVSPVYAVDLSRKGNLTVIIEEHDGSALPGINVELFLIANAVDTNTIGDSNGIKFVSTTEFSDILKNTNLNLNMYAKEIEDLAKILKTYVSENAIHGTSAVTNNDGKALFSNLTAGFYLVVQKPPSVSSNENNINNSMYEIQSFILPVPFPEEDGPNYDIEAHPKFDKVAKGKVTVYKNFTQTSDIPADYTQFYVVLSQDGQIKYTFTLNRDNSWTSSNADIATGTYDVAEINMPSGYEFVSLSHTRIIVTDKSELTVTATNKKITTTIIDTTPATEKQTETTTFTTQIVPTTKSTTESNSQDEEDDKPTPPDPTQPTGGKIFFPEMPDEAQFEDENYNGLDITLFYPTYPTYPASPPTSDDPTRIPLDNGWSAVNLGGGLYLIYDGNGDPLGYVQLDDGEDIKKGNILERLIPIISTIDSTSISPSASSSAKPSKSNPKTGDNFLFSVVLFTAFMSIGLVIIATVKKKSPK